jgi:hypothetical protein
MADSTKYPEYKVRDDSAALGTLSIIDSSGNTLFIRDRTCLGIHEDAYLLASAPKLAHALELLWDAFERTTQQVAEVDQGDVDLSEFEAMQTLVEGALAAAQGKKV